MKKLIALLLTLCLLCGGALAEAGSLSAALNDVLELVLYGSFDDIAARLDEGRMDKEAARAFFDLSRSYGAAESYTMTDATATLQQITGEYTVTQNGSPYRYTVRLNSQGKIAGLAVEAISLEFQPSEIDESIDFQARMEEIMTLLMNGEYDAFAALLREDIAASVTAENVQEVVELFGEPEFFSLVYLMKTQGYHEAIFEASQSLQSAQYRLTLDGNGQVVGLYGDAKPGERENLDEKWETEARNFLDLLLGGQYEALHDALTEELQTQLTADALEASFSGMGEATNVQLQDIWQTNGYTSADFTVQHPEQEMLYRFSMDANGNLAGLGFYPVIRIEK